MVEDSTSDEYTTTNKGVNVHSESLPARVHNFSETDTSLSTNIPRGSPSDIKNDIQHILDLMGPTTPILSTTQNTSSDADNEDSVLSTINMQQSRSSSSYDKCHAVCSDKCCCSECATNASSSKSTNLDSTRADAGNFSNNTLDNYDEIEHSCCDHAYIRTSPECLCMMSCNNHSNIPTAPPRSCEGCNMPHKSISRVTVDCKKRNLIEWVKNRSQDLMLKKSGSSRCDLYKINICGQENDGCLPKRVIFDLVDGIPKPSSTAAATNTVYNPVEKTKILTKNKETNSNNCNCRELNNKRPEAITLGQSTIRKNIYYDSDGNTRVDYYYFDHGNAQYLHTTDTPPVMKCELIAEKTERYTTRFWAEFFASIHIGVSFCISFILQLFKFLLYSVFRPIFVGLMQMWSDYLFKPFLTTLFNGVIQPFLIFLYNIATSVRDLCDPIAEAFGYYCRELAVLFRSIRLCSYKKNEREDCDCNKKRKCEC